MIKYPIIPIAQTLILSCLKFDFIDVVISPGSRNVPLAIGIMGYLIIYKFTKYKHQRL